MLVTLLAAALVFGPGEAKLAHETACALVENHTPRDAGTLGGRLAAGFLLNRVSALGLDARLDSFIAGEGAAKMRLTNVEATYRSSPDAPWAVFVSHYDTKSGVACPGANDGASTSGLLAAMASLVFERRPKGINVLFVWTDGEECRVAYGPGDGLHGSRRAAARLRESGRKVLAVVCFDMLGDADLKVKIPANVSPGFRRGVLKIAKKKGWTDWIGESGESLFDDHLPFIEAGFKAIALVDFEYGPVPGSNGYWHTPQDTVDKLSVDSLRKAGELATAILNGLTP